MVGACGADRQWEGIGLGFGLCKSPSVEPLAETFLWEGRLVVRNGEADHCARGGIIVHRRHESGCRDLPDHEDDGVEAGWRGDTCGGEGKDAHG